MIVYSTRHHFSGKKIFTVQLPRRTDDKIYELLDHRAAGSSPTKTQPRRMLAALMYQAQPQSPNLLLSPSASPANQPNPTQPQPKAKSTQPPHQIPTKHPQIRARGVPAAKQAAALAGAASSTAGSGEVSGDPELGMLAASRRIPAGRGAARRRRQREERRGGRGDRGEGGGGGGGEWK